MSGCRHERLDWEAPDPSVGIFGYSLWCDGCGAVAVEFTEVWVEGAYGYPTGWDVTEWGPDDAEMGAGLGNQNEG